jgi:hypothetical protein
MMWQSGLFSMVATAIVMIVTAVVPAKLWENSKIRCIESPFIAATTEDNNLSVVEGKYTFTFITEDGKKLPAYIEGHQRGKVLEGEPVEGEKVKQPEGLTKKGKSPQTDTAVYVAIQFKEPAVLKTLLIEGPNNYKVEVDLNKFWGTPHTFKAGEKYGIGWYL